MIQHSSKDWIKFERVIITEERNWKPERPRRLKDARKNHSPEIANDPPAKKYAKMSVIYISNLKIA